MHDYKLKSFNFTLSVSIASKPTSRIRITKFPGDSSISTNLIELLGDEMDRTPFGGGTLVRIHETTPAVKHFTKLSSSSKRRCAGKTRIMFLQKRNSS